jgi:NAD(P)-dependent dehydrogenase (short-subunit alcohol dehydrogenase family)
MRLEGKVAIVTAGSRGMGRAYCLSMAREGATVVVNYVSQGGAAEEVAREITEAGGQAIAWKADVGTKAEVEKMVDVTVERFGRLDVMVSNAGIVHKHRCSSRTRTSSSASSTSTSRGTFSARRRRRGA